MKKWIVILTACCVLSCVTPVSAAGVWLDEGAIGGDVYDAQVLLQSLGYYPYELDSYYGPVTSQAVMEFQSAYGLAADGIVGDLTMEALLNQAGDYAQPAESESSASEESSGSSGSSESSESSAASVSSDSGLSNGSTGDAVAQMQALLVNAGYMEDIVDGFFGSVTEDAVIRFQQANGLVADGIVGPVTMSALKSFSGASAQQSQSSSTQREQSAPAQQSQSVSAQQDLYEGMTGDAVKELQSKLAALGYSISVDGVFGPQTAQIVKDFQTANSLYVDGYVGAVTFAALNNGSAANNNNTANNESNESNAPVSETVYDGVTLTEDIAEYMKNLVNSVTNSDMTREEKLLATYNYIASRENYPYLQNRIPYYKGDDWPVVYAHDMMYLGGSYCHGYASLFGYAAVLSGYENVHWAQNGFHAWVDIDGLVYDPVFRESSYQTDVYGWTYEQAIANNGNLGAGYDYPAGEGTYQYIKAPQF